MVPSGKNQVLDLFPPPSFFVLYNSIIWGTCSYTGFNTLSPKMEKIMSFFFKGFDSPWLFIYVPCIYDALRCLIMVMKGEEEITHEEN